MTANKNRIQNFTDDFIDKTVLRYIPSTVKPNQVTVLRLVLTPVVYYLLTNKQVFAGMLLFIIAAFTDAVDGAMARTRKQITDLGKVIDPVADKLLILSVLFFIGFKYPIIQAFSVFIVLEMFAVIMGYVLSPVIGRPIGANIFGKLKLITQAVSVSLFLLGALLKNNLLIDASILLLTIALGLACLAGLEVARKKFLKIKEQY
jgi:CDP-diacylglycerol--glycerol-3-phosphate 3-phosphatidyltransferase